MKKTAFIICLAALFISQWAVANPISSTQALKNAQAFMKERGIAMPQKGIRCAPSVTATLEQAPYYIFNIGDDAGYVIASGDDRTSTVLAYSDTGSINPDSLPDNVRCWLDFYKEQIIKLDKQADTGKTYVKRVTSSRTAVSPMLTCKWDQQSPYNDNCPIETTTNRRCVTGCVATAMAQVMYYHRKHSTCQVMDNIPAYTCNNGAVQVKGTKKGAPIDWDNMLDSYEGGNITYANRQAVANLMFYCGSSVLMNYTSYESANTYDPYIALVKYFDYDDGARSLSRSSYTDDEWEEMVCDELEKGNPVIYFGSGHCFVLDGHDGKGYVHINWGWGGSCDGFFLLSVSTGTSEEPMGGHTNAQYAILGVVPNGYFPRLTNIELEITGNTVVNNISSLSSIPVSFSMTVANQTDGKHTFEQAIGLYYKGTLQSVVSELSSIVNMAPGVTKTQKVTLKLDPTLTQGAYKIVPLSRSSGSEKWRINGNNQFVTMVVYGDKAKFVVGTPPTQGEIISFACDKTKLVCVDNWDSNGDGELSKEEAAAVTSLNKVFDHNKDITSFDELQYFTGLTSIGTCEFEFCENLSSIIIPENVETIGKEAFFGCNLSRIHIPKKVRKIGEKSFVLDILNEITVEKDNPVYDSRNNCNAIIETKSNTLVLGCGKTTIPDGITAIGDEAFYLCGALTSLILPESVMSIGKLAFYECYALSSINIPKGVTFIDAYAFESCRKIKSITLPEGLIEIGDAAFSGTGIESVTIPAKLKNINGNPFSSCNLTSIKVNVNNPYYDSRGGCNAIMERQSNKLVIGCKMTVIPNNATAIGDEAFANCNIRSIDIPSSVKTIGNKSFRLCNNLEQVIIPEGVEILGEWAFYDCKRLTTITLSSTITKIGYESFRECPLRSVVLKMKNPVPISDYIFTSREKAILYVPAGCGEKYRNASCWKDFKNIVEGDLPERNIIHFADLSVKDICVKNWDVDDDGELSKEEAAAVTDLGTVFRQTNIISFDELQYFTGLTRISAGVFFYCDALETITFPPTIMSIGEIAFKNCKKMSGIVLPSSVESILDDAFANCESLDEIIIPQNVTAIGSYAFSNCTQLRHIDIPQNVTAIGSYAFSNCTQLRHIDIPESVRKLGNNAYSSCTALETVVMNEGLECIGDEAFYDCASLKSIVIPKTVNSIGNSIVGHCSQLAEIKVAPNNDVYDSRDNCNGIIKTADNELIQACRSTKIPNTITTISSYAFRDCISLKTVFIPASVSSIKEEPFYGCETLVSINVDPANAVYDSRDNCNAVINSKSNELMYGCMGTVVPTSVKSVSIQAFYRCKGLESIVIPEGVISIGDYAFHGCSNMSKISLPESLTILGSSVFFRCHGLTSIQLPSKLKVISPWTYGECKGLVNISIPETIVKIEASAFSGCSNLKSVSIPLSVKSISESVFEKCIKLESVVVNNPVPPSISNNTFSNNGAIILYVPKGCRESYLSAENWRYFGQIREMTGVRGDVNQDGDVTLSDVMLAVSAILGNEEAFIPLEFSDMDDDGIVSLGDIMAIVDIILN